MTNRPPSDRFISREGEFEILKPGEPPTRGRRRPRARAPLELAELRRTRNITQTQLAERLGVDQAQISRLERRTDMQLSSLLDYLTAIGAGRIRLTIDFDDAAAAELDLTP